MENQQQQQPEKSLFNKEQAEVIDKAMNEYIQKNVLTFAAINGIIITTDQELKKLLNFFAYTCLDVMFNVDEENEDVNKNEAPDNDEDIKGHA